MGVSNKVSVTLTTEQQNELKAQVDALGAAMTWTVTLTNEERKNSLKAGDATEAFLLKALQLGQQHPEILPRGLDLGEMERDMDLRPFLQDMRSRLSGLLQRVDDTLKVCGGEAFQAGLQIYHGAKTYGQGQGYDDQIEELARRFKHANKSAPANG